MIPVGIEGEFYAGLFCALIFLMLMGQAFLAKPAQRAREYANWRRERINSHR